MWGRFGQFLSVNFLSAIFGILGEFRVYIGKKIFSQLSFFIEKIDVQTVSLEKKRIVTDFLLFFLTGQ